MRVKFSVVGRVEPMSVETTMDAIPREGETVTLPGLEPELSIVRTVVWYPLGDEETPDRSSFVYIVLGPQRPVWTTPRAAI